MKHGGKGGRGKRGRQRTEELTDRKRWGLKESITAAGRNGKCRKILQVSAEGEDVLQDSRYSGCVTYLCQMANPR